MNDNEGSTFQTTGQKTVAAPKDATERKHLADRLARMVDYAVKRHDLYEDQRTKALSPGLALLGLSSFLVSGLLAQPVADLHFLNVRFWRPDAPVALPMSVHGRQADFTSARVEVRK